jgi:hypothetical protein
MAIGHSTPEDFGRMAKVVRDGERAPRNTVKSTVRQPVFNENATGLDGVVNEDWTPSQVVDVQVWNEDGYTGRMVEARAPHTDGTDMAGLLCTLVRVKGHSAFKYDIVPRECDPTGTPI